MSDQTAKGSDTGEEPAADLRLWAKESGLGGARYPAVCHALDSAAASLVLWRDHLPPGLRATIADGLGLDEDRAGRGVALWAGMHDVGKLTPGFQHQIPIRLDGYPRPDGHSRREGHAELSAAWLSAVLPDFGYPDEVRSGTPLIAQLLGGHHGRFPDLAEAASGDALTEFGFSRDAWDEQRRAVFTLLRRMLGDPGPPARLEEPTAALVCGLVILSDWLVSQRHHVLDMLRDPPGAGTADALRGHFDRALRAVPGLVDAAGLRPLEVAPASFADSFPTIPAANGLQASIAEHLPGLCPEGGLLLVTAPTGEGKTEAAFHAADLLGAATGRPGRFVALPTMATADHMYRRLRAYAEHRAAVPRPLALLHSMAWLNPDYAPAAREGTSTVLSGGGADGGPSRGDARFTVTDWLLGRKRGLLASWSVGTVDQALMAVLPTRHNVLRMLGLAGKTVIVDEVHAVDPYMQTLLEQLLRWLGHFGVPVVLLSATLHRKAADALVTAYLEGAGHRRGRRAAPLVAEVAYPGWLHADPRTGTVTANPEPIRVQERPQITVETSAVPVRERRPDRSAVLERELAPLREHGGCAAVICTTVAEAQAVFEHLERWLRDGSGQGAAVPELHLLHARFPNRRRTEITGDIVWRFGREGAAAGARPRAAILVATQVVEQSLDLDVDLLITDLAPMALLLQRAGRCWRHERTGAVVRPPWARRPRVVVLVPDRPDDKARIPRSWRFVYPVSLLVRTHNLLRDRGGAPIRVPEDVQGLVERVYEDDTLITEVEQDIERMGEELALRTHARNVLVPSPRGLRRKGLYRLTAADVEIDDHLVATRFDADSVRVLCCYRDPGGGLWLDEECRTGLPPTGSGGEGRFTDTELAELIGRTVPARGGPWLSRLSAEERWLPEAWRESFHLRDLLLLPHPVEPGRRARPARVAGREWLLDPRLGLVS